MRVLVRADACSVVRELFQRAEEADESYYAASDVRGTYYKDEFEAKLERLEDVEKRSGCYFADLHKEIEADIARAPERPPPSPFPALPPGSLFVPGKRTGVVYRGPRTAPPTKGELENRRRFTEEHQH